MSPHPDGYGNLTAAGAQNEVTGWVDLVPHTDPRNVTAVMAFSGPAGREADAAHAWAFEITYFFGRTVGEAPTVEYADGVYTCTGLMTTTHPGDSSPVTVINRGEPVSLDFCRAPQRQILLRAIHAAKPAGLLFDGRDRKD